MTERSEEHIEGVLVNSTFEKLDDLCTSDELDPIAWQLAFGDVNEYGFRQWRPIRV